MTFQNEVQEFLTHRLSPVPIDDLPFRIHSDAVSSALAAIVDKRWRRSSLGSVSSDDLHKKVETAFRSKSRLEFTVPFGGYKNWMTSNHPYPNWSEVFCLSYLRPYFERIAQSWPWNVRVDFTYLSGAMDLVSNMPLSWQETYVEHFAALLQEYELPTVEMRVTDITEASGLGRTGLRDAMAEGVERLSATWEAVVPGDHRKQKLDSARRNLVMNGVVDLTGATEQELTTAIWKSAVACDVLDSTSVRREYNKYSTRIQLVFVRGPEPAVHVGSSETSANHFWVTEGLLQRRDQRLLPRLVGPRSLVDANLQVVDVTQVVSGLPRAWSAQARAGFDRVAVDSVD